MADNTTLDAGTGGDVIASDDIGGVKYPRVKVTFGADGSSTDVASGAPLPVILASNSGVDVGDVTINNADLAVTNAGTFAVQVDNTVTVASHAVTNAGTFAVQAAQSGAWNVTNISGTVSLPTGAATAAKQPALGTAGTASSDVITVQGIAAMTPLLVDGSGATQPVSGTVTVQDGGGVITVDGTVAVTHAALTELAAAIDTELQVDVVGALPAGTNNIGDVDIASIAAGDNNIGNVDVVSLPALAAGTNNIGDVDVLTVVTGTGATNLGKAVGNAAGATDTGVSVLAVRDDALSTLSDAEGDYVPLRVNDEGALHVVSTGGAAGTEYTEGATDATITGVAVLWEDAADTLATVSSASPLPVNVVAGGTAGTEFDEDAAHQSADAGHLVLAVRRDTAAVGSDTDGDYSTLNVDANGRLHANVGVSALPTGASTSAKQDTVIGHLDGVETLLTTIDADTSNLSVVGGGTEAAAIRVTIANNSTGVISVDDNGSTLSVDGTVTANLAAGTNNIGDVDVLSIAAGDNNIGNVDIVSLPALAAGTNAIGKLLAPNIDVTTNTNYAKKYYTSAGAATDGIIWSPAAGTRWHVVSLYINVSAAATVTLEDDLAGGDSPVWKGEFAANSGVVLNFGSEYPLCSGEDAADLIITTTAGNVYVTAVGYEV